MNTRSSADKDEVEKAYQKALQSDQKALRRPHGQPITSTPFVTHAPAPDTPRVISPSPAPVIYPDTPGIRQILSDSPLSASAFGLAILPPNSNIPPSYIEEISEKYPNSQEDSFDVEQTQYTTLNKSDYSFHLAVTESAIEKTNEKTKTKNTAETLEPPGTILEEVNTEPIINNNKMNNTAVASSFNSFATLPYAVETVPFFDGQNMPVEHFVERCELAKLMLPPESENYLTKIIQARLTGETRHAVQDQDFKQIIQLTRYLKNIFGNTKSLYELQAELGRTYQRAGEQVLSYANKVKSIGRRILEAQRIMNNGTIDLTFKAYLEKELNKCFIRGLTPDIEQRISRDLDVTTTVNEALRIEKELQSINEIRGTQNSQTVTNSCQICRKIGHTAEKCRLYLQNTVVSNLGNEILICQICKKRGHSADKCRLRDPTTRNPVRIVQSNVITCQICSKPGHMARNCLFNNQPNTICQNCQRPGHSFRECRNNSSSPNNIICQNCQRPGHSFRNCRTNSFSPNNIICQICDKTGHNAKNCYSTYNRNSGFDNETCQWCNRRGHPASQCRERQNINRNRQPNNVQDTCQLCNKVGHRARECYGNQSIRNNSNQVDQNSQNQCRYCKATDHVIEHCVLRLENNNKKQGNYQRSPITGANRDTDGSGRPVMTTQSEEIITEFL